jgi:hypothetical protein
VKAETSDQSSPHPTGTSRAAPDDFHLTFNQPWQAVGFSDYELTTAKKQTKRQKFLSEMEAVVP